MKYVPVHVGWWVSKMMRGAKRMLKSSCFSWRVRYNQGEKMYVGMIKRIEMRER
jgi:hypothetical protein